MDYEIVTYNLGETSAFEAVIVWTNRETGEYRSFPADESNPEYRAWAIAEGLMEAPAEPEVVEPEPAPSIEP